MNITFHTFFSYRIIRIALFNPFCDFYIPFVAFELLAND